MHVLDRQDALEIRGKPAALDACHQIRLGARRSHRQMRARLGKPLHELKRTGTSLGTVAVEVQHVLVDHADHLAVAFAQAELLVEERAALGDAHGGQRRHVVGGQRASRAFGQLVLQPMPHAHRIEQRTIAVEHHADFACIHDLSFPCICLLRKPSRKRARPPELQTNTRKQQRRRTTRGRSAPLGFVIRFARSDRACVAYSLTPYCL